MKQEIAHSIKFIARFLRKNRNLKPTQVDKFCEYMEIALEEKLSQGSWSWESPTLGSARRALFSFGNRLDSSIIDACAKSKISIDEARKVLPKGEWVVWIDPGEVSYKIGERGNVLTAFNASQNTKQKSKPYSKKKGKDSSVKILQNMETPVDLTGSSYLFSENSNLHDAHAPKLQDSQSYGAEITFNPAFTLQSVVH